MNQDSGTILVFGLVFIACPALYVCLRLSPYLVFYGLPFLLTAVILGFGFSAACEQIEPVDYQRLALLFPLAAFVLLVAVGFPSVLPRVPLTPRLESVTLFTAFNDLKSSVEAFINWSFLNRFRFIFGELLLPSEHYWSVLYDLRDLSWCLWLGAFFGAPVVVIFAGHKAEGAKIRRIQDAYQEKIRELSVESKAHLRKNDSIITQLTREIRSVTVERDNLIAAAQALNPTLLPQLPAPKESSVEGAATGAEATPAKPKGVFGTDFL